MTPEDRKKCRVACHLLADPAPEVVTDLLDTLDAVEAALAEEKRRVEKAEKETRTAFDAGFTLGAQYGIGFGGNAQEILAAKRLERVPTAATCDELWAVWQRNRALSTAPDRPKEDPRG